MFVSLRGRRPVVALAALGIVSSVSATQAETVAGSLEGKFAVDDTGAATYSIPIDVPPGVAGLQPELELFYSSRGGNGLLGLGWSLGGLSSITRCDQTLEPHGKIHGVDFSPEDRFCLDGRLLFAVSGTYGADGTEYRTEIESYSKIVSYGNAGSGPASFKVWTKDGRILDYGTSDDSRIEAIKADGTVMTDARVWALNKVQDRNGNYIAYSYIEDQAEGSYRIDRIDYTGNVNTGTQPQSSVRFTYEVRPDERAYYMAGAKIEQSKRLKQLDSYENSGGGLNVQAYVLNYENSASGERSRVQEITKCDALSECFTSSTSWWSEATMGFAAGFEDYSLYVSGDFSNFAAHVADVNGDGLADVTAIKPGQHKLKVYSFLSDGTGRFSPGFEDVSLRFEGDFSKFTAQMADVVRRQIKWDI